MKVWSLSPTALQQAAPVSGLQSTTVSAYDSGGHAQETPPPRWRDSGGAGGSRALLPHRGVVLATEPRCSRDRLHPPAEEPALPS